MLLWLWNFLRGYVRLEVTGFSTERFLNMAAYRGVYIWDAERSPRGVQMNISVKGLKRLKSCARKTNSKTRIVEKRGLPFILRRYRKRKILLGGVIFFIAALYALSSFIWLIDVSGNERVPRDAILSFLSENGLKTGAFKYGVGAKDLQRALMAEFPDIGWAVVNIKGTRAEVLLAEIIPKQAVIDRETPCDIVAAKDGLITLIVTGSGKPLVRRNDVVKQGEILVSGMLELTDGDAVIGATYVHAYAEVWARRYTELSVTVPYIYEEKRYTGKTKTRRALRLLFHGETTLNMPWNGSSIPYANYDKITYRRQPGVSGNYPLPFILITEKYAEFIPVQRERGLAEAMELAERMITGRIIREFDFGADITDKRVTFEETPDALLATALVVTNERIDMAAPIRGE